MIILEVAIIVIISQSFPAIVMATDFHTFNQLGCIYSIPELVTGRKFSNKRLSLWAEI